MAWKDWEEGVVTYLSFLIQYSLLELSKTLGIRISRSPEARMFDTEAVDLYACVFLLQCIGGGHVVR
jgi:hypothetical protein